MCLTLPGRVIEVRDGVVEIISAGKSQNIKSAGLKLKKDDWILATGDYVVKKITADEAQEIISLFDNYNLKALPSKEVSNLLDKSLNSNLNQEEIKFLLEISQPKDLDALYRQANIVRLDRALQHICVHGIIEFANYCSNDCWYCGLRASNQNLCRYRLSDEELVNSAVRAVNESGYKILVLQSGEDDAYDLDRLRKIISNIKKQAKVFIYLSIGERNFSDYQILKEAGAGGVLMRFETADEKNYSIIRPGKKLTDRIELLKQLKSIGYLLATGFLFGLPQENTQSLVKDLLLLRELSPFMVSVGPLVPSAQTPLATYPIPSEEMTLKLIALARLLLPQSRLTITTAMETLYGEDFRQKAFLAGANSLMLNLTPAQVRDDYYIYANKFFDEEKKFEKWSLFKGDLSYQMLEEELGESI